MEGDCKAHGASFWGDENVLRKGVGEGSTLCE